MDITLERVSEWFRALPREAQRGVITELGQLIKPLPATLRVKANPLEVARVLKYVEKWEIPYTYRANFKKTKLIFTFPSITIRNQVLIGIRIL
jgi:hypothetical protein